MHAHACVRPRTSTVPPLAEERQAHKRWQQTRHDAEQAADRVEKARDALDAVRKR